MSLSRRTAARLLSTDEAELVNRTEKPAVGTASDADLASLRRILRERRDRARGMASQQRREMRGKAEARGARPAAGNVGTMGKYDLLTSALKRLGNEIRRRKQAGKAESQGSISRRALAMRRAAPSTSTKPDDRTASEGMRDLSRTGIAPSGAFEDAGLQPAMQRAKFAR